MPPADTLHRFRLTCTRETATQKRFLAEVHTSLADALAAMLDHQQYWQSVTLTPLLVPTRALAAGGTLRKTAR
jgi:hypothetical protein